MATSKVILNGSTIMDVTQDTVTTGSMLSGTTAHKNDGTSITGSIASKTSSNLTASGLTVTAPAGYYASNATKTCTDANLLAENIKKDVSIFGVTGSYEGSGGGATEYVVTAEQTPYWTDFGVWFNLTSAGLSISDLDNSLVWVELKRNTSFFVWLDGNGDDDFTFTMPSGTKIIENFRTDNGTNIHCSFITNDSNKTYGTLTLYVNTEQLTGNDNEVVDLFDGWATQRSNYQQDNGFLYGVTTSQTDLVGAELHILKY